MDYNEETKNSSNLKKKLPYYPERLNAQRAWYPTEEETKALIKEMFIPEYIRCPKAKSVEFHAVPSETY